MMMTKRSSAQGAAFLLSVLFALPLFLLPLSPANAQSQFGSWGIVCQALGPGKTRCALFQRQVRDGSGALAIEAQIIGLEPGEDPVLALLVPLGVRLKDGVEIRVDRGDPVKADYRSCTAQGCTARVEGAEVLSLLEAGRELNVRYAVGPEDGGQFADFTFSLIGVHEGITAIENPDLSEGNPKSQSASQKSRGSKRR